jgi:hypothetical protein
MKHVVFTKQARLIEGITNSVIISITILPLLNEIDIVMIQTGRKDIRVSG